MLSARIDLDLPSELPEPPGVVRNLVQWLMGRVDEADEDLQHLLLDNLTVFEQLLLAFGDAGFDDVVSVVVDGRAVYVDTEETIGDLAAALEGTVKSGAVRSGFSVIRTTFRRSEKDLRVLAELRLTARVPEGHNEVQVRISAREHEVEPLSDEGPREYAGRIRSYIREPDRLEGYRRRVEGLVQAIVKAVGERLPDARSKPGPVSVRVVAPGVRQVGRFRHLGFKELRRGTAYNALPTHERIGAYDDPLTSHYYSPYQDLFDWIALGEILAGHWNRPDVEVLHPTGVHLFRGSEGHTTDPRTLELARDVVRVNPEGNLVVDESVPLTTALHPAEAGTPHGTGWAGEQWADDIAEAGGEDGGSE